MKKRCAGLMAVVLSLAAFGVASAQIAFYGVVDPNTHAVVVDSARVFVATDVFVFPTPGWQATGSQYDTTRIAAELTRWPDSVELIGTVDMLPNISMFPSPVPNTFYRFLFGGIVAPRALFYEGMVSVEEPRTAAGAQQRLSVSPSVVTELMAVRLLPARTGAPVVQIHDAVGNVVRSLACTPGADGYATATWNRDDELGHAVPEGIYFCRYATPDLVAVRKILVTN